MAPPEREVIMAERDFRIEYDPSVDILFAYCPTFSSMTMDQITEGLRVVVKTIITRKITNLLIDPNEVTMEVTPEQHRAIIQLFVLNLFPTSLQKLARLASADIKREERVQAEVAEAQYTFELRNFEDENAAIQWLTA